MRNVLPIGLLLAGLAALWTIAVAAQESRMIELTAPRSPGRGEAAQVQITTGPLPQGARLVVKTEQGDTLGAVVPFGPRAEGRGNTATVPIPRSALSNGRLRLQLQLVEPGAAPRAPRPEEVQRLDLVLVPE